MVAAVHTGQSVRAVARAFRVSVPTVQRWVTRAGRRRLDRVDWADRPPIAQRISRTPPGVEDQVLTLRRELRDTSALGEYGARAIHREWPVTSWGSPPAVRTIGRILDRRGALDGHQRIRRPAPPRGWYLPAVAQGAADCDCFDVIEGLVLQGGPEVEVLTGLALHAGLPDAWPTTGVTTARILPALQGRWRTLGVPAFAQFDNDTCFQGPHQFADVVGQISRLCLQAGCTPVFTPVKDPSFQAALENFNGRWQAKVWSRFEHQSLAELRERTGRYLEALHARSASRIEAAPARPAFPARWRLDLQAKPRGRLLYLRRTSDDGCAEVLGHKFPVERSWTQRLVRAEVDLDAGQITFYGLRRRDPSQHIFLKTLEHKVPHKPFQE